MKSMIERSPENEMIFCLCYLAIKHFLNEYLVEGIAKLFRAKITIFSMPLNILTVSIK